MNGSGVRRGWGEAGRFLRAAAALLLARAALAGVGDTPVGAAVVSALVDSDGDGMPDVWERAYDLDIGDPTDASSDSDADGVSALEEYRNGTDPLVCDRKEEASAASVVVTPAQPVIAGDGRIPLYNVTFSTPPHTVGSAPAVSSSVPPCDGPSSLSAYGGVNAIVESALGALVSQPVVFRNGGQLVFNIDGLPQTYSVYTLEYDVYVDAMNPAIYNNSMGVLLDTPQVRRFDMSGGGRASTFIPYQPPSQGTYSEHTLIHVAMTIDLVNQQWMIVLDNTVWPVQNLAASGLRAIRFSLGTQYSPTVVGVDNIVISGVTPAPTAVADTATTAEDTPKVINVLANDYGGNRPFSVSSVTQAGHGSVAIRPSGTNVTYVPATNWYGTDTFCYTVCDQAGGTAAAKVTVVVTSAPDLVTEASPVRHGTPMPFGYGAVQVNPGAVVTNWVASPVDQTTGVRYVCGGWTGSGCVPASGTTNRVVVTMTNDSALFWQWSRECLLTLDAVNGSVSGATTGWKPECFVYDLIPSNAFGYAFDHWETNGVDAGAAVPLSVTMGDPISVRAVFAPAYGNMTDLVATRFTSWALSRQAGTMLGTLVFSNRQDSVKHLIAPFHYAVAATAQMRLMRPAGQTVDGLDYVDITTQVVAGLPQEGNGDLVLDPGEAVVVSNIEFYTYDRSSPTGFVCAVWCDPPGAAAPDLSGQDTDRDGMPNGWEESNGLCENDPRDAGRDDDGDGSSNAGEYAADTDPNDAAQHLRMIGLSRQGDGNDLVQWQGGRTATQYVQACGSLGGGWTTIFTNTPPTEQTSAVTVNVGPDDKMFFRIKVGR